MDEPVNSRRPSGDKPADGDSVVTAANGSEALAATPASLEEALALIDRLRTELAERKAEADKNRDQFLRERAELENFKRRMQREKAEALRFASEPLLRDLLPVVDNLERAVAAAGNVSEPTGDSGHADTAPFEALRTGVELVLRQATDVLARSGVSRIRAKGEPFDPARHEALAQVETSTQPPGTVVDEHLAGYTLHERLLRPAQVTVAKAAPQDVGGRRPIPPSDSTGGRNSSGTG